MKTLISLLSTLSILLCAFQAQALYCSQLLDNKVDTQPTVIVEDTAALREAKSMEEADQLGWAIEALERRLVPESAESAILVITLEENSYLARLYTLDHQYQKSIERSLYSLQNFKSTDGAFAGLRTAYRKLHTVEGGENLARALQVTQAHIKFNPQNYRAHKALLTLLIELNRSASELLPVYDKLHLLAKEEGYIKASWANLKEKIELLITKGRFEEALRDLALYRSSERTWGHRQTTRVYLDMRLFDKALDSANIEINIIGFKSSIPHIQKIRSLIALRKFDTALTVAQTVKGHFPIFAQKFENLIIQAQHEHSEF